MATDSLTKGPVLSDLLKTEQPHFLGREAASVTTAAALPMGTVLQGGPAAAVQWDLTDPEDIYGILLVTVPAGAAALKVPVLIAGPAAVNPKALVWKASATAAQVSGALERLKRSHFVFTRERMTDSLYPDQLD
ncbi:MAG: head decoration protein [Deltaproteobacteria bacterium]|jgi:hypothetical protein|nr:head decoration protein [Deltaproteobacteria bacterium]